MNDPSRILADLERHFERYAVLPPGLPLVLALWGLATHLFDCFDAFPYLAITSPTKRCGKTRVAELLEMVCLNPLRAVGISVAALFRTIEAKKPTLIIDEAESLRGKGERAEALREILNAGYRKGQTVIRCVGGNGKDYKTREFETFCPKALVLIGSLPDTLADRSIPVEMRRRTTEPLERFRFDRAKRETRSLVASVKQWAKAHRAAVARWYHANDLSCLEDREAELWLPLFAVCAVLAPERLAELEAIALRLAGAKAASEPSDLGIKLLADIRDVFDEVSEDRLRTEVLVFNLNAHGESPWPAWNHGKGLNPYNLGRLLAPFNIRPGTIRFSDDETAKGYYRDDFTDAWACYLPPPEKRHTVTRPINTGENSVSASVTANGCDGAQNEENPNVHAGCDAVTDQKQG
jgi:hypothetical protein